MSGFSPIQNHILSRLKNADFLRYSELQPKEIPNDLFNYHLQFLVKKEFVVKKRGGYSLAEKGIKHVADPDIASEEEKIASLFKVNVITILSRKHKGKIEILSQLRTSHPSYGKIGVMGGIVRKGEPLEHAAVRKLKVETGLVAKPKLLGIERRLMYKGSKLFSDIFFPITYADEFSGTLEVETEFGRNFWVPIDEAIKNESSEFDSLRKIVDVLKTIKKGKISKLHSFTKKTFKSLPSLPRRPSLFLNPGADRVEDGCSFYSLREVPMTRIEDLGSVGFCAVEYPDKLQRAVARCVVAWKAFCALPEEVRRKFPYDPSGGLGVGYELKKIPGATLDMKEDFHFTMASEEWLKEESKKVHPVAEAFVKNLAELASFMKPLVTSFAGAVEHHYLLPGFTDEIQGNAGQWFLRFLHYFPGAEKGNEIAKAHADKSGFTLHFYESAPGLQYLDRSYQWQDIAMSPHRTVILPGMRGQYRSAGKLKATFHRVIATEETAKTGRFSAVAFIHPDHRTPQYDKAGVGRLQEMKLGFNYKMPFGEFAKLFKFHPKKN